MPRGRTRRAPRRLFCAGVPRPMRFHDLRHSAATLLLRADMDIHRVQRILRHRDAKLTTGTYAHLLVEDLRAAVEALPASTDPLKSREFATRLLPVEGQSPKAKAAALQEYSGNRGLQRIGETGFEPATPWSRIRFGALGWAGIRWYRSAPARHHSERRANRYI